MKTILSLIVLAMAVLVMGCGEPATTAPGTDAVSASGSEAKGDCSCCTKCTECEDGENCECTAKEGEKCDCKCESKEGDMEEVSMSGSDHKDGSDHKEGSDHK